MSVSLRIIGIKERQNIEYEKALSQALEETFANLENIKPMTAEDACDRLRKISYQAF